MSFTTSASAADTQSLVELVLEARAEVIVNVTDVDSVVIINHVIVANDFLLVLYVSQCLIRGGGC